MIFAKNLPIQKHLHELLSGTLGAGAISDMLQSQGDMPSFTFINLHFQQNDT